MWLIIALTLTQSLSVSINESHTSGMIFDIVHFDILNKYCKLVYESPVAKNRSVTANLSLTVTASLNLYFLK